MAEEPLNSQIRNDGYSGSNKPLPAIKTELAAVEKLMRDKKLVAAQAATDQPEPQKKK